MSFYDRFTRKAPIVVPKERVVEIDYDEDAFTKAIHDAETVARNAPGASGESRVEVEVVILVSKDHKNWKLYEVFDSGRRGSGVRLPSRRYLFEVAKRTGNRYARCQKRATI